MRQVVGSPRELVRKITDQAIAVLRNNDLSNDEKRKRIEDIVYDYVDFETMSRLVLARNWRTVGEAKQREFVEEFKRHLSVTYGKNVENYRNETVTISGDRQEARGDWTVKTQIVRSGPNDIFVDYRLRKLGDEWKIIDVIIERVSLVSNFRSQFQEILANGGIERLLKLLRRKNAEGTSGLKS
ncbi:MAG: MlaC/ttg2D family ABC transporter substrate-binding protein [Candidatus Binatia bacterium]